MIRLTSPYQDTDRLLVSTHDIVGCIDRPVYIVHIGLILDRYISFILNGML